MYIINNGLREWQLDEQKFNIRLNDIYEKFNINSNILFYSQQDEDKYILQYVLKEKITDGVFLEIGAFDGVTHSNTKTLEDYFGFSGILIEPQPINYAHLIENRPNCECYNCIVSNRDEQFLEFVGNNSQAHIKNESDNIRKYRRNLYYINNRKMRDILKQTKYKYIDIMSIDVEGNELELLKSIDFSFPIFYIFIEAASDQQEKNMVFGNYLKENGFTYKERQRGNEVWVNLNYFRRDLFNF
jgi:FkbM family methyltransferase